MKRFGRVRLMVASACLCAFLIHPLGAQTQAPPPSPAPQQQPDQPPANTPAQPQRNPFENVPTATPEGAPQQPAQQQPAQQPRPTQPQMEAPKPVETAKPAAGEAIEAIEFRGARRVPQDTLKALISSKAGDIYNQDVLRRDYMALWNTGRFDDIQLETEPGRIGLSLRIVDSSAGRAIAARAAIAGSPAKTGATTSGHSATAEESV